MPLTWGQRRIFAVTWVSYAGYYLCRKNLSIVLPAIPLASSASLQLANIVFGYSLMYALGQFGWGFLADLSGAKRIVGGGLLLVVASNLLMATHQSLTWLLVFACLNGIGQATGWSGLVKIMASWFNGEDRGIIMAWWGTNYVLGGFVATAFATWSITQHFLLPSLGWRRGFLFPALVLLLITMWFLSVRQAPPRSSFPLETAAAGQLQGMPPAASTAASTTASAAAASNPISTPASTLGADQNHLMRLMRDPSLWTIGISYFFLEMCRYALMFWLPYYLVSQMKYTLQVSGYVSSLYELVGIGGAVLAGYVSDRFHQSRRAPVSVAMLAGLGIILFLLPALAQHGLAGVALGISLSGVLSYGPDTLLSGAGAQDIGNVEAAATASGLIDGIGHLGAIVSPYAVIFVSQHYGWNRLFLILAASAVAAALVLLPIWNLKPRDRGVALNSEELTAQSAL